MSQTCKHRTQRLLGNRQYPGGLYECAV